ncbi:MAG: ribosome maturation factor RimP [Lachnospiraceae bacterium]|nr:ribosome maturation factor RimP [Lachnospiraceae bacterium]
MGSKKTIEEKAWAILEEACRELALLPVDAEYVKNGSEWNLLMYADKEGGIGINECEELSRLVDPRLDEANFISDPYTLIVSSPGLGRQIRRPRDFVFAMGKKVELHTYKSQDGRKEFTGVLLSWDDKTLSIREEDTERSFLRQEVSNIRLAFEL